ncbi:hypothetical protein COOONC_24646 [Cooperia oncophora]
MTAVGAVGPGSTMTAVGAPAGGPGSTMTAVGGVGPGSTMTAVGAPAGGAASTMTAVGAPGNDTCYRVDCTTTVTSTQR